MATRLRDVQYHVLVRAEGANHGPGAERFELTGDVLNLVWQRALNLPGNLAFTLMRDSKKLPKLQYLKDHIELWREDRNGTSRVFQGKIVQPDYGPHDVVILCWDYLAFFQRVIVAYYLNKKRKRYARVKIGTGLVADLFDRIPSDSVMAFVKKGTIQNPLGDDDATVIKTSNHFGIAGLQDYLTVFYDMAEMSATNTDNTVVFEIDEDYRFNFWRDRRADKDTIALTYPGNIADHSYREAWGGIANDMLTLVRNQKKATGREQLRLAQQTGDVGIDTVGRLSVAAALGTTIGITGETKNKGRQRLALERMAKTQRRLQRQFVVIPHQGVFTRYPGSFDLGHNLYVHIQKSDDSEQVAGYRKLLSIGAEWSVAGEQVQLGLREKEVPD